MVAAGCCCYVSFLVFLLYYLSLAMVISEAFRTAQTVTRRGGGMFRRTTSMCSSNGDNTGKRGLLLTVPEFQAKLENQLILAPLTRGGNLPFRRLCAEFHANFTMSEMAFARNLFKGYKPTRRKERALAKKGEHERYFGFQIATKSSDEAIGAAAVAVEEGAAWLDLNCGCPIYEATRRGLGAAMLKRPSSLHKLVELTAQSTPLPMTVKIRIGVSDGKINAHQVVAGLAAAGAAAVTIHGRTMEQRYTRPADWAVISDVARANAIPVVGNGDILSWYEAEDRLLESNGGAPHRVDPTTGLRSGVAALMAGRGALIKPWIFKEYAEKQSWHPTAEERVGVYWRLATYFKEHFGSDDFGKRHSFYFLPWHFSFFSRYRPLPEDIFRPLSRAAPLIQNSRLVDNALVSAGLMSEHGVPRKQCTRLLDQPLERLLRCEVEACHLAISEALWDASSAEEAVALLQQLADTRLDDFERRVENDPSSWPSASDRSGSGRKNDVVPATAAGEGSWEVGGAGPRGLRAQADGGGAHAPPARSQDGERGDGKNKAAASLLDLRVGTVVDVAPHPSSPGLWVTKLDMGPDATAATSDETMGHGGASLMRTAVTARDPHAFATGGGGGGGGGVPSERTLPKVVVLTNLKARDFAGVTSDALVLFSEGADGAFAPVTAPPAAPAGAQVVFLGVKATPLPPSNKAVEAWRRVEREGALQVGADGVARLHTRSRVQRERADGLEDSAGGADEGPGLREQRAALKAGLPLVCRMPDAVKGDAAFSSPSFFCTSAVAGEIA